MKRTQAIYTWMAIGMITSLSSCFVMKEYERPQLQTEHLFRTSEITDSLLVLDDSTSLADVSWKNLFTDALLQQYINTALEKNIDIRVAVKNIDAAESYVKQGKWSFGPTINGTVDYTLNKNSGNSQMGRFFTGTIDQYQLGANLSWEADIWGKIRSQQLAYNASYLQSIEAHKAVKTRLIANIVSTYYQLCALSDQMRIAQQTIASRDSSLQTITALKAAGLVTEVAVKQTEAQVYDARLVLLNLQQRERILENTFCLLLNEPSHSIARNSLDEQTITTPLTTGVPAKLLANRPDIRQAEFNYMNSFQLTNVARSQFYPSLTLTATSGLQSLELKDWISAQSIFFNVAGGLVQPILRRRQIKTAYEIALYKQEQAALSYEKALMASATEVSNALFDYQTQSNLIQWEEKRFQAYNQAAIYSEALLSQGLANYLEVLTAKQNVLSAQLGLVNVRLARLNSIVTLYTALGGGWQ